MKKWVLIVLCLSLGAIVGCVPRSRAIAWSGTVTNIDSPGLISLCEIVHLADAAAAKELKRVNEGGWPPAEGEGPFELADYDKAIQEGHDGDRPLLSVRYQYRKPHAFEGHPAHFSVWVFRDTGEIMFFGGR